MSCNRYEASMKYLLYFVKKELDYDFIEQVVLAHISRITL